MKHRHLELPRGTPADSLPSAAIHDLLERGDLDDWEPLLDAIARDANGPLGDRVMRLVDAYPMYGASPLWRAWIDRQRARVAPPRSSVVPVALRDVRLAHGLTQVEMARRMCMTQSDHSKLERRNDVRLSTLRAYARALGATLRVILVRPDRSWEIRVGPAPVSRRRCARRGARS